MIREVGNGGGSDCAMRELLVETIVEALLIRLPGQ
jgi:hypothetical protein